MSQALLERTLTIEQIDDPWVPQQKEMNVSATKKSILVVEDDSGIRDILEEVLQEETIHQVFLAQDGETALSMLQTAAPNLLLLDYRLPGINGLELLDHVRKIKGYEQTPVVLMSASLARENIVMPHLRYLQKPFDLEKLLQMVEEALSA